MRDLQDGILLVEPRAAAIGKCRRRGHGGHGTQHARMEGLLLGVPSEHSSSVGWC